MRRALALASAAASLIAAVAIGVLGLHLALQPANEPPSVPAGPAAANGEVGAPRAPPPAATRPGAAAEPAADAAADAAAGMADVLAPATEPPAGGFVRTVVPPAPPEAVAVRPVGPVAGLTPAPPVKPGGGDERRRYFHVVVADAGTIRAGRRTLRLADVDVPSAEAECGDGDGNTWSCGTRARTALRRLVQNRAVDCRAAGAVDEEMPVVRCTVGRVDLATWLVENGWAAPAAAAAPGLAELGRAAREAGRGLWQIEPVGLDEPDEPAEGAAAAAAAALADEPADGAATKGAAPEPTADGPPADGPSADDAAERPAPPPAAGAGAAAPRALRPVRTVTPDDPGVQPAAR